MNNLKFTFKSWPVIAAATIGLCYLTQLIAGWLGIELKEQTNVELIRKMGFYALKALTECRLDAALSDKVVRAFLKNIPTILVIMPFVEECYFRHFLYKQAYTPTNRGKMLYALIPTIAIVLVGGFIWNTPETRALLPEKLSASVFFSTLTIFAILEYPIRLLVFRLTTKFSEWLTVALSSAAFSAAHYLSQPFPDNAFIALFFFGLSQCWLYRRTGRLWCAILNHGLFNLTNLVLLFVLPET